MITLGCLGQKCFVIRQLFLVGEGDAVYTLQGVVFRITQKVGCRVLQQRQSDCDEIAINHASADLGNHECLDLASMRNMRPDTQIDHWPATVNGGGRTIGNLGLDEVFLVLVVLACPDRSALVQKEERVVDVR